MLRNVELAKYHRRQIRRSSLAIIDGIMKSKPNDKANSTIRIGIWRREIVASAFSIKPLESFNEAHREMRA